MGCQRSRPAKEAAWNEKFAAYAKAFPQEAAEFTRRMKGEMPSDFDAKANEFIAKLQANPAKIASRKASQNAIEAFGPLLPEFLGGSADLAPSNLTLCGLALSRSTKTLPGTTSTTACASSV
ncbi:hypothetical protein FZ929_06775 [Klebsiella pneumoniae]|uniref:Transketolase N-terminal domain-containing protein n=1 Tax=Klebsiella pneumoniae TaxID=573 RepID=A0A5C2LGV0_KLEPN|nr:hypothetical protein FZ929_06775 [Klebsiella pneumoniae]